MDYAVWYNILLQSNLKDIKKMFKINSIAYGILQDKYFWIKKFENDNLTIPSKIDPQNTNEWIRLYIASVKARVLLNTILIDVITTFDIYIDFYPQLNVIFSKYIDYKHIPIYPSLIISTDTFVLNNHDENIEIPKTLLLDILTHVYYVNYDKFIDTNNGPYDINKINKSYKNQLGTRAKDMNNQYILYGII